MLLKILGMGSGYYVSYILITSLHEKLTLIPYQSTFQKQYENQSVTYGHLIFKISCQGVWVAPFLSCYILRRSWSRVPGSSPSPGGLLPPLLLPLLVLPLSLCLSLSNKKKKTLKKNNNKIKCLWGFAVLQKVFQLLLHVYTCTVSSKMHC